jgi:hypothetical protein
VENRGPFKIIDNGPFKIIDNVLMPHAEFSQ